MPRDPNRHPDACPEMWYAISAEEDHFWIQSRFLAFLRLIEELGLSRTVPYRGLDIGCGWGVLRRQLESASSWVVDGTDVDPTVLSSVASGRGRVFRQDITDRAPELREQYDLLLVFDVLEHLADERSFLESLPHYLRPGGTLFLHVPALPLFFSTYDRAVGHLRRYGAGALEQLVGAIPGLSVRVSRYWGASLMPLLGIRKVIGGGDPDQVIRRGFRPPNSLVNGLLRRILACEIRLLPWPRWGASVFLVAERGEA